MVRTTTKTKTKMGRPALGTEDIFHKFGGKPHLGTYGWREYHAKQPAIFTILQEHIDNGIPGATPTCIVALAFSAFLAHRYVVEVQNTIVRVIDEENKKRLTFRIPNALRRRLRAFDTLHFWDLPPALYRLDPLPPRSKMRKAGKNKDRRGGSLTIVSGKPGVGTRIQKKPKKNRNHPTRVISHGRIVKWADASPMTKKKKGKKRA